MRRAPFRHMQVAPLGHRWRVGLLMPLCLFVACEKADRRGDAGIASDSGLLVRAMSRQWNAVPVTSFHEVPSCFTVTVSMPAASCRESVPPDDAALADYSRLATATAQRLQLTRTADALRTIAMLELTVNAGNRADLTLAVDRIDEAAGNVDGAADVLIDQSAIHLQQYARTRDISHLLIGINSASRAADQAPRNWRACWNNAIALTWAGARVTAAREWQRCTPLLPRDARSRVVWRDPATAYPPEGLRDAWLEATRELAWATLLPQWSQALVAGDTLARDRIEPRLDSVMQRIRKSGIDAGIVSIRDELRASVERGDPARTRALAAAVAACALARSSEGRQHTSATRDALERAIRDVPASSATRPWLLLERANQDLILGRGSSAVRQLETLSRSAAADQPVFRARLAYSRAVAVASIGRTTESVVRLADVERLCRQARLEDCVVGAASMRAFYAAMIGDIDATERAAARAVDALEATQLSQWHWSVASLLRQLAEWHGLPRAATSLGAEAAEVAERLDRADLGAANAIDDIQAAFDGADLDRAERGARAYRDAWLPRLSADDQRTSRIDLLRFEGELMRSSNPRLSLRLLDSAATLSHGEEIDARITPLRVARARSLLAVGDTVAGLRELDGLLRFLRGRGAAGGTVFDAARLARVLTQVAHVSADALRARGYVLGALHALSGQPFLDSDTRAGSTARSCCSPGAAIPLAVRIVGDSAWVFSRVGERWSLRTVSMPTALVRGAIALDSASLAQAHTALLGRAFAPGTAGACIDARGTAAQLPWGALRNPATGRYLIETLPVRLVGDVTRGCPRETPWERSSSVVLVDAAHAQGSRALPAARREIAALQSLWGRDVAVVTDARRGPAPTLRAMSEGTLVHFAGHAVLDRTRPDRSYLLLNTGNDSSLAGDVVSRTRMPRTRLVVLSACETRGGVPGALSGFDTLAGAFLDAGAHEVIGAGWPVDDVPTATFMAGLHGALRRGRSPAQALRDAQVMALRSSDPALRSPRVWAAFQIMGSGGVE